MRAVADVRLMSIVASAFNSKKGSTCNCPLMNIFDLARQLKGSEGSVDKDRIALVEEERFPRRLSSFHQLDYVVLHSPVLAC